MPKPRTRKNGMCVKGLHDLSVSGIATFGDGRTRCRACKRRADYISLLVKRKRISRLDAEKQVPWDYGYDPINDPKPEPISPGFRGTYGRWFTAATTWMEYGACRDPEAPDMFPDVNDKLHVEACKAVCAGCFFRAKCLSYAIENEEQEGVWGGLTPGARKHYARDNRLPERTAA